MRNAELVCGGTPRGHSLACQHPNSSRLYRPVCVFEHICEWLCSFIAFVISVVFTMILLRLWRCMVNFWTYEILSIEVNHLPDKLHFILL